MKGFEFLPREFGAEEQSPIDHLIRTVNTDLGIVHDQLLDRELAEQTCERVRQVIKDSETRVREIIQTGRVTAEDANLFNQLARNLRAAELRKLRRHRDAQMAQLPELEPVHLNADIARLREEPLFDYRSILDRVAK